GDEEPLAYERHPLRIVAHLDLAQLCVGGQIDHGHEASIELIESPKESRHVCDIAAGDEVARAHDGVDLRDLLERQRVEHVDAVRAVRHHVEPILHYGRALHDAST